MQLALGHSTPTITLNTYVHEWPEALDRTRALVDAALGEAPRAASGGVGMTTGAGNGSRPFAD